MKQKKISIEHIPAILWGEPSDKLYLFVHGQGGSKEEARPFSEIVCPKGWQALSFDLPGHGERTNGKEALEPWTVVPELQAIMEKVHSGWGTVALRANSIGAWLSMLSFAGEPLENCLFVSPVLNMEHLILDMMQWAGVTEERLRDEKRIPTTFGQTLSWEYLTYTRHHPLKEWAAPTSILYGQKDSMIRCSDVDAFVRRFHTQLTVMPQGEHWFHTPQQLEFLKRWEFEKIR